MFDLSVTVLPTGDPPSSTSKRDVVSGLIVLTGPDQTVPTIPSPLELGTLFFQRSTEESESSFVRVLIVSIFRINICAMEPIETTLEFIVDYPKFQKERPFAVHLGPDDTYSPLDPKLNTIMWEPQPAIIHDMRLFQDVKLNTYGFQSFPCEFSPLEIAGLAEKGVEQYQVETETFLKENLKAEKVICYDYRVCAELGHCSSQVY